MKNFLKENWFKLMTGTAMLIFACGFFIYAVSPSYANNSNNTKEESPKSIKKNETLGTGNFHTSGIGIHNGRAYLVDFEVNGGNTYYSIPLHKFKALY